MVIIFTQLCSLVSIIFKIIHIDNGIFIISINSVRGVTKPFKVGVVLGGRTILELVVRYL